MGANFPRVRVLDTLSSQVNEIVRRPGILGKFSRGKSPLPKAESGKSRACVQYREFLRKCRIFPSSSIDLGI